MPLWAEIVLILALLVANGAFAMSEIAVVTARRSRLERRAGDGDRGAAAAAELKREPTQFLSAVQIGISLVGVLAGALGGARLSRHVEPLLADVSWIAPYADTVAFVLVVAAITYCSLVIGELVPKRIALAGPERVAARVARPMRWIATATRPVVWLLTASTNLVTRLLRVHKDDGPETTEEDLRAMIAQAARSGVVNETEEDLLERVFYVGDRQVRAVMTPRPDVDWLDTATARERLRTALATSHHSRFLVCDGALDRVRGVVRATDVLSQSLAGSELDLDPLLRTPLFVPPNLPVLELLRRFRQSDVLLAVVLDEYASVLGVVTLNDVLTDLVADVPGRVGPKASDVVRRDDGSWLVDGTVPIEDLERALAAKLLPLDEPRGSRTLGGLAFECLGDVPREGQTFRLAAWTLEIVDMDGRRVDRVLVRRADDDGDGSGASAEAGD